MKKNPKEQFRRYGFWPLFLTVMFNFLVYGGTKIIAGSWKHYSMETVLDSKIPVIPWTVAIYFGCYLVWAVNYLIAASREEEFIWRFFAADILARLVCMFFYLLLPTTNTRPVLSGNGFWEQALLLLYRIDAADNLFPSIHCMNSWFCYLAVRNRKEIPFWYRAFTFVAAIAVFVSTLTTKQHVLADVFAGVMLAEGTWQIAGRTALAKWYENVMGAWMTKWETKDAWSGRRKKHAKQEKKNL